ncbi:MAG: hypothetical protein WBA23_21460 [Tunicatimonas sp.]|uniref:hypothetical protein n=1 Tax=Tunicatimonas sp. TaxID=1940096 RepID=UPI003C74A9BF
MKLPYYLILLFAQLLIACESRQQHYGQLIGQWNVVEVKSREERIALDKLLDSRSFSFTGQGDYRLGTRAIGISGKWKIVGDRIRLIQPEIKALNGGIISAQIQQEWELTLSEEWMIWRGTALNDTQHLKILFQKKQENNFEVSE